MLSINVFDGKITEHFNISEFACHANHEVLLNADVLDHIYRLEKFRQWYSRPVVVNSGYRTPEYNKKVGGAKESFHVKGVATDIALPAEFYTFSKARKEEFLSNIKKKWYELCAKEGKAGGVGFYKTFFHLDSRPAKQAFWDER